MQAKATDKDKLQEYRFGACGCGRSPTGQCIGWHGLTEEEFQEKMAEYKAKNVDKQ